MDSPPKSNDEKDVPNSVVVVVTDEPAWCEPFVKELRTSLQRASPKVEVEVIDANTLATSKLPWSSRWVLAVNRLSARPATPASSSDESGHRLRAAVTFHRELVASLDIWAAAVNRRLVNALRCHLIGTSKLMQSEVFSACGVEQPSTIAIRPSSSELFAMGEDGKSCSSWLETARRWATVKQDEVVVLVKPNVGGRGAAITRHALPVDAGQRCEASLGRALVEAAAADGVAIVQHFVPSADGCVHRVELVAGGRIVYRSRSAVSQQPDSDGFNYCGADVCRSTRRKDAAILVDLPNDVPAPIEDECRRIAAAAQMDMGSIEFLISPESGRASYIDINPVPFDDGRSPYRVHGDCVAAMVAS